MTSTIRSRATPKHPRLADWSAVPLLDNDTEVFGRRSDFGSTRRSQEQAGRTSSRPSPSGPRPCVTLDLDSLEAAGVLAPATSSSVLARTFRQLKQPLLAHAREPGAISARRSVIVVTSAIAGEGKTFCAINLALSLAAEVDSSVLLIEAEAERPDLMRRLGIRSAGVGLFDLLTQPELHLADVALETNVPKLELLPSGTPHALPGELLASNAMAGLLADLTASDPQRIVILDAPPLIGHGSAAALASRAGQVVLVVEASTTPRRAVLQALGALDHCDLVMPLLNKARVPMAPPMQLPRRDPSFDAPEPILNTGT